MHALDYASPRVLCHVVYHATLTSAFCAVVSAVVVTSELTESASSKMILRLAHCYCAFLVLFLVLYLLAAVEHRQLGRAHWRTLRRAERSCTELVDSSLNEKTAAALPVKSYTPLSPPEKLPLHEKTEIATNVYALSSAILAQSQSGNFFIPLFSSTGPATGADVERALVRNGLEGVQGRHEALKQLFLRHSGWSQQGRGLLFEQAESLLHAQTNLIDFLRSGGPRGDLPEVHQNYRLLLGFFAYFGAMFVSWHVLVFSTTLSLVFHLSLSIIAEWGMVLDGLDQDYDNDSEPLTNLVLCKPECCAHLQDID